MAKMTMGLPLKPNSSLYARIHLGGESDPNQSPVFFEDLSDPGETLPLDAVFIARWDEKGVTIGCDFELASSDQSGRLGNWSYSPNGRPVIKFTPETLKAAPLPPAP
jgi:hypothetical protein